MADWISITSLAVAIVGIPVAVWATRHFSSRAGLAYTVSHEKVFDTSESTVPSALVITVAGENITNFHRWKFGIWNYGNSTFDRGNIIETDPIGIEIRGHRILDVQGGFVTRETIAPSFQIVDGAVLEPSFEICDRSDGFVFFIFSQEIEKTDESEHLERICLRGSLKGLPNGLKKSARPLKMERIDIAIISIFSFLFLVIGFGVFGNGVQLLTELDDPFARDIANFFGLGETSVARLAGLGGVVSIILAALAAGLGGLGFVILFRYFWMIPSSIRTGFDIESSDLRFNVQFVTGLMEKR